MYKSTTIYILENRGNEKRKKKHILPRQCYKLLPSLGLMYSFLLPHLSLWWTLDMHVEDMLAVVAELPVGKETSNKT